MTTIAEIFKTNVNTEECAARIVSELAAAFPQFKINFDLDDCDHILRVEGKGIDADKLSERVTRMGYSCEILL